MRRTLDSVIAQSVRPDLWVIVDDGSSDATPEILADYAARHDWIRPVRKPDRGARAVGPGVIEAFYFGLRAAEAEIGAAEFLCKLDLDLDLPPRYFEALIAMMRDNPRIGTCSGKPWFDRGGRRISEKCGDEMSVGMTKFYRAECFRQIGGFVQEVMWDAIDCHKARQLGWIACSRGGPDLDFQHLRPMGTSQASVYTGRMRHGYGQWYMGSDFLYFTATCLFRMAHPPYLTGGLATWWGYVRAWAKGAPRHPDPELRAFVRAYQRRALRVGKARAVAGIDAERAAVWSARQGQAQGDAPRRALLIGPDFFGYNQSIAQALEARGYATTVIDSPTHTPKGWLNRLRIDLAGALGVRRYAERWRRDFNARVARTGAALSPDLLLVVKGDWVEPETFRDIPARRRAIWFHDAARRSGRRHLELARLADAAFVFEKSDVAALRAEGVEDVRFLPMGFDPARYRDEGRAEKDVDLCFVGRMYPEREALLTRLSDELPEIRMEVWGRYVRYREPRTWRLWLARRLDARQARTWRNRNITPEQVNDLYNRSRIVLNIHHAQSQEGCNPRTFEIMGAGAFQIADANRYIRETFGDGIVRYEDPAALAPLVRSWLARDAERAAKAAWARRESAKHTFDARVADLLAALEEGAQDGIRAEAGPPPAIRAS